MKNTIRLSEEISKDVTARKHITTSIDYFYDNEEDAKTLTDNITRILTKNLGDANIAKLTFEQYPSEHKIEVVIIEHV